MTWSDFAGFGLFGVGCIGRVGGDSCGAVKDLDLRRRAAADKRSDACNVAFALLNVRPA